MVVVVVVVVSWCCCGVGCGVKGADWWLLLLLLSLLSSTHDDGLTSGWWQKRLTTAESLGGGIDTSSGRIFTRAWIENEHSAALSKRNEGLVDRYFRWSVGFANLVECRLLDDACCCLLLRMIEVIGDKLCNDFCHSNRDTHRHRENNKINDGWRELVVTVRCLRGALLLCFKYYGIAS